jgi:hypothetical protein
MRRGCLWQVGGCEELQCAATGRGLHGCEDAWRASWVGWGWAAGCTTPHVHVDWQSTHLDGMLVPAKHFAPFVAVVVPDLEGRQEGGQASPGVCMAALLLPASHAAPGHHDPRAAQPQVGAGGTWHDPAPSPGTRSMRACWQHRAGQGAQRPGRWRGSMVRGTRCWPHPPCMQPWAAGSLRAPCCRACSSGWSPDTTCCC